MYVCVYVSPCRATGLCHCLVAAHGIFDLRCSMWDLWLWHLNSWLWQGGSSFPDLGWNLGILHGECGVLATGPPATSHTSSFVLDSAPHLTEYIPKKLVSDFSPQTCAFQQLSPQSMASSFSQLFWIETFLHRQFFLLPFCFPVFWASLACCSLILHHLS